MVEDITLEDIVAADGVRSAGGATASTNSLFTDEGHVTVRVYGSEVTHGDGVAGQANRNISANNRANEAEQSSSDGVAGRCGGI